MSASRKQWGFSSAMAYPPQRISFGRTESAVQGWRGKSSWTPIKRGGVEIGMIEGTEGMNRTDMRYSIALKVEGAPSFPIFYSLKDAKAAVLAWES